MQKATIPSNDIVHAILCGSRKLFGGEDDRIVGAARICQAEYFGQTLTGFSEMRSKRAGDSALNTDTYDLRPCVSNVCRQVFLHQHLEGTVRLVLQCGVDGWLGCLVGEALTLDGFQCFGDRIRIFDCSEGLQSVQVVDQYRNALGPVRVQEASESK